MTSLYQLIADMAEQDWNYYAGYNQHRIQKPFVTETDSKDFIRDYFRQGGKEAIIKRFMMDSFTPKRADHTVSIFFLGLALFHQTQIEGKTIFKGTISDKYDFFHFIWFVTCLAHDIAFDLEKDEHLFKQCPDLPSLKSYLQITTDLSECQVDLIPQYLFRSCETYFKYLHNTRERVDHGMYAGFLMYDALVKNRQLQHEYKQTQHLSWAPWLDLQYAYAAATVAIHNIWFPMGDEYVALYHQHGLEELIGKGKISFSEAPLLYILAIVDTLDPVKALQNHAPIIDILRYTFLSFDDSTHLTLQFSPELNLDENIESLKRKVKELEEWLNVSVSTKERQICIRIIAEE